MAESRFLAVKSVRLVDLGVVREVVGGDPSVLGKHNSGRGNCCCRQLTLSGERVSIATQGRVVTTLSLVSSAGWTSTMCGTALGKLMEPFAFILFGLRFLRWVRGGGRCALVLLVAS